jgi:5'-3' exonuclease
VRVAIALLPDAATSRVVKLLLIDGHYYAYRSFFAIQNLSNSRGEPTNAVYGFLKTVRKMLVDLAPDRAAVCWDEGIPLRRSQLQPAYKTNRTETPDALKPQIDRLRDIVPKLGLPSLGLEDTEADDLIATYTTVARAAGHEVFLATNDKDLFQLVDEKVRVYSTNKSDLASPKDPYALLDAEAVRQKWGVPAARIGDILALIGDSVDNIPGVPGIGPKTATTLILEYGDIDALLANLPAMKNEKMRVKLDAAREQIAANREMVRLDLDLPLPMPIDDLRIAPRYEELLPALRECEFKTLTAEVEAEAARKGPAQGELF